MTAPRLEPLAALTLGGSVGTRPEGVTAQVVVVKHWDDLEWMQEEIPGKIAHIEPQINVSERSASTIKVTVSTLHPQGLKTSWHKYF